MLLDLPADACVAPWLQIIDLVALSRSCTAMRATVQATALFELQTANLHPPSAPLRALALWRGRRRAGLAARTIAAGFDHSLTLSNHNQLLGFGGNHYGQLSNGNPMCTIPVPISFPIAIRAVAAGGSHSLVIDCHGGLWSWGRNEHGQLGLPIGEEQCRPSAVALQPTAVAVVAGWRHSLVIDAAGAMLACGEARHGQLGLGSRCTEPQPQFTAVRMQCKVVAAAAGRQHSLLVGAEGGVWTCGLGRDCRLGHRNARSLYEPTQVAGLSDIIAASAGEAHSAVLDTAGGVWCFGSNSSGQCAGGDLAPGTQLREPTQLRLRGLDTNGTVQICAGQQFTGLLSWRGEVTIIGRRVCSKGLYTWSGGGAAAVVAGGQHFVARYVTGEVATCGEGSSGQLGGRTGTHQAPEILGLALGVSALAEFAWNCAEQI